MTTVKDGFAVGSDLAARMATALNEATEGEPSFTPIYSIDGPDVSVVERDVKKAAKSSLHGYWMVRETFPGNPMSGDTQNIIKSGNGLLWLAGTQSRAVIDGLYTVLRAAGYTTGCTDSSGLEAVGQPVGSPFSIGNTMTAWRFNPVGGIDGVAQSYGSVYAVAQFIDFQVQVF